MKLVVLIVILDCVLAAQPNLFFIGVGKNDPRLTENSLNTLNENKWPAMNPVIDNVYANRPVPGLWQNVNNLPKIIGPDGFNSNYFSSLENLMSARNAYGARILSNPYVYLSDNLVSEAMLLKDSTGLITKSTVLVSNPDYKEISESGIGLSMGDTVSTLSFLPSEFEFRVYTETGTTLNLLQSYYPGWVAYLDKHRARIYKSNTMFMTVYVPPGEHTVRFSYQNVPVMVAAAISYAGFFVAMVLISVFFFRKKEGRYWIILGWLIPAIIVIRYFFLIG